MGKIFFNYSIDCELPPDGTFGGPANWEVAEASVRGFVESMDELRLRQGTSLFVYPDVAMKQPALFREMAGTGIEIALHLNGMRYSRMKTPAWLGSLSYEEQLNALRKAKEDLEEVIGKPCLGYRACYASTNHFTYPALEALGFVWASTTVSGRYQPEVFARWTGAWPFPHHASGKNKLIPGDLNIYEIPITNGIHTFFQGNPDRPLDMRTETPPVLVGPNGEVFKKVIEENLVEMERRDQPVRTIIGASHNTNPYGDHSSFQYQNLRWVCEHARISSEAKGYTFIPAHFMGIRAEADRICAF